jgi:hypothetical protein
MSVNQAMNVNRRLSLPLFVLTAVRYPASLTHLHRPADLLVFVHYYKQAAGGAYYYRSQIGSASTEGVDTMSDAEKAGLAHNVQSGKTGARQEDAKARMLGRKDTNSGAAAVKID